MLATRYLLFYNLCMTAGWSVVLFRALFALYSESSVYEAVDLPLKIFQTGALLEVLHSLTGLIRAPASTTAVQVASRLMLVWGIANAITGVREEWSFQSMVLAWSLTEIPRYFYFSVAAMMTTVPYWLTVTRYSTFIPLYPIGASSEWMTLLYALPYIKQSGMYSISLPNRFNFGFDYFVLCVIILILYAPGLPYMYIHMIRQRRKYVYREAPTAKKVQ